MRSRPPLPQPLPDTPFVAGTFEVGGPPADVVDPWNGEVLAQVRSATAEQLDQAVVAAEQYWMQSPRLSLFDRATVLDRAAALLEDRVDVVAGLITRECGKPITAAQREASRSVDVLRDAAAEARRWHGELLRFDGAERHRGALGLVRREPIGPVLGFTPANSPLNLVTHKVAPAVAVGAPIVIKPHPSTPLSALYLAGVMAEAGLPAGGLSVLPGGIDVGRALLDDPRLRVLSFTGSAVGWSLKGVDTTRKAVLELGGNAPVIVDAGVDPATVAPAIASGAANHSGQSCVSSQRVFVHREAWADVVPALVEAFAELVAGDPADPATQLGPPVEPGDLDRTQAWIDQAVAGGATVLIGGRRAGRVFEPTIVTGVAHSEPLYCQEVFAPVICLEKVGDIDEAFAAANASSFGIHVGLFTRDLDVAMRAWSSLRFSGVVVNESSDWRSDIMPYGGTRASGCGREGTKYAMEELTETRTLVMTGVSL